MSAGTRDVGTLSLTPSTAVRPALALEEKVDEAPASGESKPRSKGVRTSSSLIGGLLDWCDVSQDLCGVGCVMSAVVCVCVWWGQAAVTPGAVVLISARAPVWLSKGT
jgi:hypothetical protein